MNTQNQAQAATPAAVEYFDSVLYCRAYLNEVKLVDGKKGKKPYCAINASFLEAGADDKKVYRTIDLIVRGAPAKQLLWQLRDRWPADRTKRDGNAWLADINIGSIRVESFRKRDGSTAAVLKGRLLNIRALRIGEETVHGDGDFAENTPRPVFVAPCYINEIKPDKKTMKIAALDGKVDEPESFGVNLYYGDNGSIAELLAMGICPKGYANRDTNPKVFAVLEIGDIEAAVYKDNAYAKGTLLDIRYLKADGEVIVGGKKAAAA